MEKEIKSNVLISDSLLWNCMSKCDAKQFARNLVAIYDAYACEGSLDANLYIDLADKSFSCVYTNSPSEFIESRRLVITCSGPMSSGDCIEDYIDCVNSSVSEILEEDDACAPNK
jgi:hypothetical protein